LENTYGSGLMKDACIGKLHLILPHYLIVMSCNCHSNDTYDQTQVMPIHNKCSEKLGHIIDDLSWIVSMPDHFTIKSAFFFLRCLHNKNSLILMNPCSSNTKRNVTLQRPEIGGLKLIPHTHNGGKSTVNDIITRLILLQE
jgi:hypothetical protein